MFPIKANWRKFWMWSWLIWLKWGLLGLCSVIPRNKYATRWNKTQFTKSQKVQYDKINTIRIKGKITADTQFCFHGHRNSIHAKIFHCFPIRNPTFANCHTYLRIGKLESNMIQLAYYCLFSNRYKYQRKKLYINRLWKYVILKISSLWRLLYGIGMLKLTTAWKAKLLCSLAGGSTSTIKNYHSTPHISPKFVLSRIISIASSKVKLIEIKWGCFLRKKIKVWWKSSSLARILENWKTK